MEKENNIVCPKCGAKINVNDILYKQIQNQIKKEYSDKDEQREEDYKEKLESLKKKEESIEESEQNIQKQINDGIKQKLSTEKTKIEKAIRDEIRDETDEQLKVLKKELEQKSAQVKELNKTKAEVERLKREKDEMREVVALEKERELSEKLKEERVKIQKQSEETHAFKIKELEKQLDDQKQLAEEMKRKVEQGSMQLQGEVQELVLEDILKDLFPIDAIEEVGKGVKGADVIQTVRNKIGNDCGIILFESKRTKSFSNEWINKLKADAISAKADICVIVTETLPEGIDRIGQKDGVWICSFNDFKGLVLVLREGLIKISEVYSSQSNKGEKMQMLYDYLTSNEFRFQVGAIIEGFTDLQESYNKEKRAMERIWKEREKQLEKVLLNTNHFIGSIKGIAGSSMPELKQIGAKDNILELGE